MQDRASESSMEHGHHLYCGSRPSGICDRNCRLVQPQSFGLQCSKYNGRFSLCRNIKNGCGLLRKTRDFQFWSRKPIHQFGVCGGTPGSWYSNQHGRAGSLFGQCKDGALLVGVELWGHQNQGVCQLAATPLRCPALCEFLQLQADSFGTPISDAGWSLFRNLQSANNGI